MPALRFLLVCGALIAVTAPAAAEDYCHLPGLEACAYKSDAQGSCTCPYPEWKGLFGRRVSVPDSPPGEGSGTGGGPEFDYPDKDVFTLDSSTRSCSSLSNAPHAQHDAARAATCNNRMETRKPPESAVAP